MIWINTAVLRILRLGRVTVKNEDRFILVGSTSVETGGVELRG